MSVRKIAKKVIDKVVKKSQRAQRFDRTTLEALPRKRQIQVAIELGIQLHRGISKTGIVNLILAKR